MMSLDTIRDVNEEIAAKAAQANLKPFVPNGPEDVDHWQNRFPFPNLGYHEPDDWEKTETDWFVDKSGFGSPGEPALTIQQFSRQLRDYVEKNPSHGYAITEEGQFQVYISAFSRK